MNDLGVAVPVIGAPMAGVSTPALVAAVSGAGGLGFLAVGYQAAAPALAQVAEVRSAGVADYGVNLFVPRGPAQDPALVASYHARLRPEAEALGLDLPLPDRSGTARFADAYREVLDALVTEPVPWVSFTFGLPMPGDVARLRRAGSRVAVTVTSAGEARAADEHGVDALVVQSHQAGGHRGTFDPADPGGVQPLPALVGEIAAVTRLPLVAAGGVMTAADAGRALHAGAAAIQAGTALLLADEAGTHPLHRAALSDRPATVATRAFTGRAARGLRNAFIERHEGGAPLVYPHVHDLTTPLRAAAAAAGDGSRMSMWAGTGAAGAIGGPAADVVRRLAP